MTATAGEPAPVSGALPLAVRLLAAALAVALGTYLASLVFAADADYDVLFDGVVANLVYLLAGMLVLARAALVPRHRTAFALLGLGVLVQTAGNVAYVGHVQHLDPVPVPSLADVLYLAVYPLFLAGVVLLARTDVGRAHRAVWIDGLIAALGSAAGGALLGLRAILPTLDGALPTVLTNAAYPVFDLMIAAIVVGAMTMRGRRPSWTWLWLAGGLLAYTLGDSFYLVRMAQGTFHAGTLVDGSWAVALTMVAAASWARDDLPAESPAVGPALTVPVGFSLVAVAVVVAGTQVALPDYVVVLAALTLLVVLARTSLAFRDLRTLAVSRREARTDELTGLANRRSFLERLDAALAPTGDGGRSAAVVLLDLDGFKEVNDTLGHHVGDELLRQIGPRLPVRIRGGGTLARLGGDEFALVVPGATVSEALVVARRMGEALAAPFELEGMTMRVGASIGIAVHPQHSATGQGLLQCADVAMYAAKALRAGVAVYDPDRDQNSRERLRTRQQLRQAIDEDQLEVHYQPQCDVRTGRVSAVEALVRWRHPERGLLYPDDFLTLVEQAGLMPALTRNVLHAAVAQCAAWLEQGHQIDVSVNLSAGSLHDPGLPAEVAGLLAEHGLAAERLTLEITEDMVVTDPERSLLTLQALNALGVGLSVDDYGTGYASLSYLRDLPVDELKIDRTFIRNLEPGTADAAIVASTSGLAHALGMRVVAEGVETAQALELLGELGADLVQGYLLSRPVPADELTGWMRARSAAPRGLERPVAPAPR